jgi:hypothetical protein
MSYPARDLEFWAGCAVSAGRVIGPNRARKGNRAFLHLAGASWADRGGKPPSSTPRDRWAGAIEVDTDGDEFREQMRFWKTPRYMNAAKERFVADRRP